MAKSPKEHEVPGAEMIWEGFRKKARPVQSRPRHGSETGDLLTSLIWAHITALKITGLLRTRVFLENADEQQ